MKRVLIIIVILAVLGAGGFLLVNRNDNETESANTAPASETQPAVNPTPAEDPQQAEIEAEAAAVITYTDDGFSPSTVKVKSGQVILVKNDSSGDLQFSSDEHPTHELNDELNHIVINPGESQSFDVTEVGTWGYHNHLNSSHGGTIVAE